VTALNTDGLEPLKYAMVEAADLFDEGEASLQQLSKKGGLEARAVREILARLKAIVAERAAWED